MYCAAATGYLAAELGVVQAFSPALQEFKEKEQAER
jgi:hypothetical protein